MNVVFIVQSKMRQPDILHVLRELTAAGCPADVLGYSLQTLPAKENEELALIEFGHQLLIEASDHRNDILRWIDSEVFQHNAEKDKNDLGPSSFSSVKERLSFIVNPMCPEFFEGAEKVSRA